MVVSFRHFAVHRMVGYVLLGSSTVIIGVSCELLRCCDTNGEVHGRWHDTSPCGNERTTALWTNALRAYEGKSSELIPPGPQSRESVQYRSCYSRSCRCWAGSVNVEYRSNLEGHALDLAGRTAGNMSYRPYRSSRNICNFKRGSMICPTCETF